MSVVRKGNGVRLLIFSWRDKAYLQSCASDLFDAQLCHSLPAILRAPELQLERTPEVKEFVDKIFVFEQLLSQVQPDASIMDFPALKGLIFSVYWLPSVLLLFPRLVPVSVCLLVKLVGYTTTESKDDENKVISPGLR